MYNIALLLLHYQLSHTAAVRHTTQHKTFLSVNSKIFFNCDDCLASCFPLFTVFVLS